MRSNTGIRLEDLTKQDIEKILGAYRGVGLKVIDSAMPPEHIAKNLKEELKSNAEIIVIKGKKKLEMI